MVFLESATVESKTRVILKEPMLEIMEVSECAVVVKMIELTGDRFELSVYAPSGEVGNTVQRGPIRMSETTIRVASLEPSQVYVVWVKVFSDEGSMESKQKGFKTLPPKVKTIWDEADHTILGVSPMATRKEVIKAWRQKSLTYHPDKETDPEKKDAAEDMMKRLNLAKQNMLAAATDEEPEAKGETNTPTCASSPPAAGVNPDGQKPDDEDGDQVVENAEGGEGGGFKSNSSTRSEDFDLFGEGSRPYASPPPPPHAMPQQAKAQFPDYAGLRINLNVHVTSWPRVAVVSRSINEVIIEVSGLPSIGAVEVQMLKDSVWETVCGPKDVESNTMQFSVPDLEENTSYSFRARLGHALEPLRFVGARFAAPSEECEPPLAAVEGDSNHELKKP